MPVTPRRRVPVRFSYQPITGWQSGIRDQVYGRVPILLERTPLLIWCEDCLDELRTLTKRVWGIHWQYEPLDAGLVTCPQCQRPFTGEIAGAKYLAREAE